MRRSEETSAVIARATVCGVDFSSGLAGLIVSLVVAFVFVLALTLAVSTVRQSRGMQVPRGVTEQGDEGAR